MKKGMAQIIQLVSILIIAIAVVATAAYYSEGSFAPLGEAVARENVITPPVVIITECTDYDDTDSYSSVASSCIGIDGVELEDYCSTATVLQEAVCNTAGGGSKEGTCKYNSFDCLNYGYHSCTDGACSNLCAGAYVCNSTSRCYQNTDCSLTNCEVCLSGCTSGTCNTCSDPDRNVLTLGTCTNMDGTSLKDYCSNSTTLQEAYCTPSSCAYMAYSCPAYGYNSCLSGVCVNICTAGYVCNGTSQCYQNTNCALTYCTPCTLGCTSGVCTLPAPTNLHVVSVANNCTSPDITIAWSAVTGATSYNVYVATGLNPTDFILRTTTTTVSYIDTVPANPSIAYYYKVSAVAAGVASSNSSIVSWAHCGNGVCETACESYTSCPSDCPLITNLNCIAGEVCRFEQADCAAFGQIATGARCHSAIDVEGANTGYCCKSPTCTARYTCNGTSQCYTYSNCTVSCATCPYGCNTTTGVCLPPSTCTAGYVCNSTSRCYKNTDCSLTNCSVCTYGCTSGVCIAAPCTAQWICNGTYKCYKNADCSITSCTNCTYGCSGGTCNLVPCNDTDGGDVPSIKGTVWVGASPFTDYCSTNYLNEYYCNGTSPTSKFYYFANWTCPTGYSTNCTDGAVSCRACSRCWLPWTCAALCATPTACQATAPTCTNDLGGTCTASAYIPCCDKFWKPKTCEYTLYGAPWCKPVSTLPQCGGSAPTAIYKTGTLCITDAVCTADEYVWGYTT